MENIDLNYNYNYNYDNRKQKIARVTKIWLKLKK